MFFSGKIIRHYRSCGGFFLFFFPLKTLMILYLSLICRLSPDDFFSPPFLQKTMQLFYEQDIFPYCRVVTYVE